MRGGGAVFRATPPVLRHLTHGWTEIHAFLSSIVCFGQTAEELDAGGNGFFIFLQRIEKTISLKNSPGKPRREVQLLLWLRDHNLSSSPATGAGYFAI
jgi:hypothetical protein